MFDQLRAFIGPRPGVREMATHSRMRIAGTDADAATALGTFTPILIETAEIETGRTVVTRGEPCQGKPSQKPVNKHLLESKQE
jgi:hypothetical protein